MKMMETVGVMAAALSELDFGVRVAFTADLQPKPVNEASLGTDPSISQFIICAASVSAVLFK